MIDNQKAKQTTAISQAIIKILAYMAEIQGSHDVSIVKCVLKEEQDSSQGPKIQLDDLVLALVKMDDVTADIQDPLKEVNLGSEQVHQLVYISGLLDSAYKEKMINLLT